MRALEGVHRRLQAEFHFVHLSRWRAIWRVALAIISGKKLWLTALGRALPSKALRKHAIKAVDRLLGNALLHKQRFDIGAGLARIVLAPGSKPLILVDTMEIRFGVVAFTAAIAHEGRAIPIWSTIVSHLRPNARECRRFVRELAAVLPLGCVPILATDAGFESGWFHAVQQRSWDFVGRVRGRVKVHVRGEWQGCPALHQLVTRADQDLGAVLLGRRHRKEHRLVLSRKPKARHRQVMTRTGPSRDTNYKEYRKNAYEPLVLVTTLRSTPTEVVELYRKRMTIEESFRDLKNHRWGWSLRHCRTRSRARLEVLLLIAAIAMVVQALIGMAAEACELQYRHQANTVRRKRVLSFFVLGGLVLCGDDLRLVRAHAIDEAFSRLRERWLSARLT